MFGTTSWVRFFYLSSEQRQNVDHHLGHTQYMGVIIRIYPCRDRCRSTGYKLRRLRYTLFTNKEVNIDRKTCTQIGAWLDRASDISSTGRGVGHAKTNQFREQFAAKTLPHCTSAHQAVLSRRNQLLACIEGATTMVREIFLPGSFRWGVDHM